MAATEGGVTPWYLLTLGDGRPAVRPATSSRCSRSPDSAGYKALQWEADAVKNGWVSPGSVSLDDSVAFNNFTGGQNAIVLATGPGNLATANDPSQSQHRRPGGRSALVPGVERPGRVVRPARGPLDPGHGQAQGRRRGVHQVVGEAGERDRDLQDSRATCRAARRSSSSCRRVGPARRAATCSTQELVPRRAAVPAGRPDLVLAVQRRRAGPAQRGRQGPDEHRRTRSPSSRQGHRAHRSSAGLGWNRGGRPQRPRDARSLGWILVAPAMAAVGGADPVPARQGLPAEHPVGRASCSASRRATSACATTATCSTTRPSPMRSATRSSTWCWRSRWSWCWASSSPSPCTGCSAGAASCWRS